MKQSVKTYFAILVGAALLVPSCTRISVSTPASGPDPVIEQDPANFQNALTQLSVTVPDFEPEVSTRASFLKKANNALQFSWASGDHLGFWPSSSDLAFGTPKQAMFIISQVGANASDAEFVANGWGLLRGRKYYSYYPYSADATYDEVTASYSGQTQTANANTAHLGAFDYMYSSVDVPETGSAVMNYHHLNCIAHFILTIPAKYSSVAFSEMKLSAASDVLIASAQYNPSMDTPVLTNPVLSRSLSVGLDNITCDANGVLDIYCMLCPNSYWNNNTITVSLTSENKVFDGEFTPTANQQAGSTYSYSVTMQAPVVDLSANGTANCYIVPDEGEYKFQTVKGNTATTVTPSSVDVLWETFNTSTMPTAGSVVSNATYNNGYIYFSSSSAKGNALIVARDSNSNILWSWHIWCTDSPADQSYKNEAGVLMDRNLGALSATGNLSAGLFYQYGRKDPFPGPVSTGSSTLMKNSGATFDYKIDCSSTFGTVDYSIKCPNIYIKAYFDSANGHSNTNGDWLFSNLLGANNSLWSDGSNNKTMYDPCPPGYKVPDGGTSSSPKGFWGRAMNVTTRQIGLSANFTIQGNSYSFATNSGLTFPLSVNGQSAFYPTSGYYTEQGSFTNNGRHIMIWTDSPFGTDNSDVWQNKYSGYFNVSWEAANGDSNSVAPCYNSGRAAGRNVRCMRIETLVNANSAIPNESFGPTPTPSAW